MKYTFLPVIAMAIGLTACKKETHAPHQPEGTAELKMKISLVNGHSHVDLDQTFTDGAGNMIRITTLKFFTGHIHIEGHSGEELAAYHQYLLVDAAAHDQVFDLGNIDAGHMHWMNFKIGLDEQACMHDPANAPYPMNTPGMHGGDMGYCFLNMEGRVDVDGDGDFEGPDDTSFTMHCGAPDMLRHKQLMVHQDIVAGSTVVLPLQLDVQLLLGGLDLREQQMHMGGGAYGAQLMDNLATAIGVHEH